MRVMRVSEFEQWTAEHGIRNYWFDSDNSPAEQGMPAISQKYSQLAVSRFYDRILFRNPTGTLLLKDVKEVRMFDERGIGQVFDIVCGKQDDQTRIWRFLAD